MSLIYEALREGKGAILLVPEISLTPQLLGRLAAHFGEKVAVLHSSLRIAERFAQWRRIRDGEARVVVGTRSAVFAPVRNLGLLILDEEQEHTYKSENSPRYHAREIALYRGAKAGALVLLGSATPSIESMYKAKRGDYTLYTLKKRYNEKDLPQAQIVDLKQEIRQGNATAISLPLEEKLRDNIISGQQSILFLNRIIVIVFSDFFKNLIHHTFPVFSNQILFANPLKTFWNILRFKILCDIFIIENIRIHNIHSRHISENILVIKQRQIV